MTLSEQTQPVMKIRLNEIVGGQIFLTMSNLPLLSLCMTKSSPGYCFTKDVCNNWLPVLSSLTGLPT